MDVDTTSWLAIWPRVSTMSWEAFENCPWRLLWCTHSRNAILGSSIDIKQLPWKSRVGTGGLKKIRQILEEQKKTNFGLTNMFRFSFHEVWGYRARWTSLCVVARNNTCTRHFPELRHMPCSHMITVYRVQGLDMEVPPRMCFEVSNEVVQHTNSPSFEPYLDPS